MKDIRLLIEELKNFKGQPYFLMDVEGQDAYLKGINASGKTTAFDAITWLLFGKNSNGDEKFGFRPVDSNGNAVHGIDVSVEATVTVNGENILLKKTNREKWVKKRGEEVAQYQGSENLYEINGYPRKESEYKAFINDIISEEAFKMLTSPTYFANLPWKKQREMLMTFATKETDADMAIRFGGFDLIVPELKSAPSLDAVTLKFKGRAKDLGKLQDELPIRIDELTASLYEGDVKHLKQRRAELVSQTEELKEIEKKLSDTDRELPSLENQMKARTLACRSEANKGVLDALKLAGSINDRLGREIAKKAKLEAQMVSLNNEAVRCKNEFVTAEKEIAKIKEVSFNESKYVFNDSMVTCPTCGQKLPKNKADDIKAKLKKEHDDALEDFNASKKQRIAFEKSIMNDAEQTIEQIGKDFTDVECALADANKNIEELNKQLAEAKKMSDAAQVEPDMSKDADYVALEKEKAKQTAILDSLMKRRGELAQMNLEDEIWQIDHELARISASDAARERIVELREQQKDVAQKVADCEHMIYLIEQFTKRKLDDISGRINSHFNGVTWKLFDVQVNGGIKETCEMAVNGVKYSDLNSSDRIIAGLNVISALQELYGARAFVFVDNAETINDFRIPKMKNQMILLKVTDDEVLRVEVE